MSTTDITAALDAANIRHTPEAVAMLAMSGLLPCRKCGADCRVEQFEGRIFKATLWVCSKSVTLGGGCTEDAYLTEAAWNQREAPHGLVGELEAVLDVIDGLDACAALRAKGDV